MGHPARHEIEKHAKNEFAVAQERIAVKHAKKWRRVLVQIAATGNIGGYAQALTESKAKHVRKQIIALAEAYVKTFDLFGVPSDAEAERSLEAEALRIAAGSSSAVMGELDLIQGRIRVSLPDTGSSVYREIHQSMQSAVNAGKLKLRRQRIKFARSTEAVAVTKPSVGTSSIGNGVRTVADATEGMWHEYRAWFNAKLESLEAMAARADPKHLPEDEQGAQKFATAAMRRRFDEIAEFEYRQWLKGGSPHETFSTRLTELQPQVLEASLKLWSLGSDILRKWYETDCQPRAASALSGRVQRWKHRARTTEIVRHLSRDRGLALAGLIEQLDKLTAEEAHEVPALEERRRLRVWIHPTSHRFEGGHSGDFLERVRLIIANVGLHLRPPEGIPPLDFCLRILLHELVCERESLNDPQIARLNSEQLGRYLWGPHSGGSITPEDGQVFNLCEALKWYCQRLLGLCQYELVDGKIRIAEHGSAESPDSAKPLVRSRLEEARSKVRAVAKSLTSGSQTLEQAAEALELEAKIWAQYLYHAILEEAALEGLPPETFDKRASESAQEIALMAASEFSVQCGHDTTNGVTPILIGHISAVINSDRRPEINTRDSIVRCLKKVLADYPQEHRRQNLSVYKLTCDSAGDGSQAEKNHAHVSVPNAAGLSIPASVPEPASGESEQAGIGLEPLSREERLQAFIVAHPGTTLADVKYSARVHTTDFQDWRNDRLKPQSVMSVRIEDVLSGATQLKKKPRKRRPD